MEEMKRVQKGVGKVNLDNAIAFTKSSFSYKDPYQVNGNLLYKLRNKLQSFYNIRMTENEFHDFKPYKIESQFTDISKMVYRGYTRNDKVLLARSLSESMFDLMASKQSNKEPNPFMQPERVQWL